MPHVDPERYREWRRQHRALNHDRLLATDRERKRKYGRPCIDCGRMTDGSNGREKAPERCVPCASLARKVWTQSAVIEAIQRFAERYGRPPAATDWNVATARRYGHHERVARYYADGDYPHTPTVQREFGSWNAAIEAAGFTPRKRGCR